MKDATFITIPRALIKVAQKFPFTDWNEIMRLAVKGDAEAMKDPTNSRGKQWLSPGVYRDTASDETLIKKYDADRGHLPAVTRSRSE